MQTVEWIIAIDIIIPLFFQLTYYVTKSASYVWLLISKQGSYKVSLHVLNKMPGIRRDNLTLRYLRTVLINLIIRILYD